MHRIKYGETDDGEIEFVSLTKDKVEETLDLMKTYFPLYENTARALNLSKNKLAVEECSKTWRKLTKDGLSIIAVQKNTGRVVGHIINKIQTNNLSSTTTSQTRYSTSTPELIAINRWVEEINSSCDLFSICNTDCLMTLKQVGAAPEFWGRRIGYHLVKASLEAGRRLRGGEDVRVPVDDCELPPRPTPTAAFAYFTSFRTQKIGRSLGFKVALEVPPEEFEYDGKKLVYEPETQMVQIACTQPEFIGVIEWLQQIESLCDLFRLCRTDCILEMMFVGTVPDFWGRRIGYRLIEATLEAGRRLRAGEDVRVPVDGEKLPPRPTPKIASAVFTSHKTQKIAKRLGFVVAVEVPADRFEFDGRKLEFEPETKTVQIGYKVLE